MIISGEKAPAFSATTLNIPKSPHDITPQIIANSRMLYSRPREVVEQEIREAIEAAEKWKKELSDSGREAGERGNDNAQLFNPSNPRLEYQSDKKPSFKFTPTPQADFRKQKISPNQAEDKPTGLSLKDLGMLYQQSRQNKSNNKDRKQGTKPKK